LIKQMKIKLVFTQMAIALSLVIEAQTSDFLAQLETRFQDHINKFPRVQINAVFNQNQYIPGDTVFFSVQYLLGNNTQVAGQDVLYLDVVSSEAKIKHRTRFKVKDGFAYNQIRLPEDLDPGIYKFYIYSEWMKNFGVDTFYHTSFSVTNSNNIISYSPRQTQLAVLPEGGKLTNGVVNYVYAIGSPGELIVLKSQNGEMVDSTKLNAAGVGNFQFVPAKNMQYLIEGTENRTIRLKGNNDGVGFHLTQYNHEWVIELQLPANSIWSNRNLYLITVAKDKIINKHRVKFDQLKFSVVLPALADSQSIHHVYLLSDSGEEVAQRIFIPNTNSPPVKINMRLQQNVKQRQPYTFGIDILDENDLRVNAHIAVVVTQKQLFNEEKYVPSYLKQIGSTFEWAKNHVGHYSQYLNEYLATQLSQRFNWKNINGNEPMPYKYTFKNDVVIKGKLVPKQGEKIAPDSTRVIAFLQKNVIGYETVAIKGDFTLPLTFDFWDQDEVFIMLRYRDKNLDPEYSIQIEDDTSKFFQLDDTKVLEQPDGYGLYQKKRNLIDKSYSYFTKSRALNDSQNSLNHLFEEEFPPVDNTTKLADYIVFPTMDDLLKEVVTFVQLKRKNDEATVRLFYRYEKSVIFYKHDPLYIIDGVMTSDTDYFLGLKPENLLTIKAINNPNKLAQLGPLGHAGVIFVESKSGNLGDKLRSKLFIITGLSKPMEFSDEKWIKEIPLSIPDLRATLYWMPLTKFAGSSFEATFNSSDDIGKMSIKVIGFTPNGNEIFTESHFEVEPNPNRN